MEIVTFAIIVVTAWVARKDFGYGFPEQPLFPALEAPAFIRVPAPHFFMGPSCRWHGQRPKVDESSRTRGGFKSNARENEGLPIVDVADVELQQAEARPRSSTAAQVEQPGNSAGNRSTGLNQFRCLGHFRAGDVGRFDRHPRLAAEPCHGVESRDNQQQGLCPGEKCDRLQDASGQ